MAVLKAKRQHVHETTAEDRADLHARPQGWDRVALVLLFGKPALHGHVGRTRMVIRHRQMPEAIGAGLANEIERLEAAIAAERVAVEIQVARTALRPDRFQN